MEAFWTNDVKIIKYRGTWVTVFWGGSEDHGVDHYFIIYFALKIFIEIYLIYNVVLVSGVQQSDSVLYIYIYVCIYTHTHITHISSHTSHLHPFIFWWSLSLLPWLSTVNSAAVKVAVHVSFRIMVLPDISPGVELQNQMLQYSEKKGSLQVWALLS